MNASQLNQDIETGALTEVPEAASTYYSEVRGLTARQSFVIYPDDTIASLTTVDGTGSVLILSGDDEAIFRHRYPQYFQ